jgi:hypothetical protein
MTKILFPKICSGIIFLMMLILITFKLLTHGVILQNLTFWNFHKNIWRKSHNRTITRYIHFDARAKKRKKKMNLSIIMYIEDYTYVSRRTLTSETCFDWSIHKSQCILTNEITRFFRSLMSKLYGSRRYSLRFVLLRGQKHKSTYGS